MSTGRVKALTSLIQNLLGVKETHDQAINLMRERSMLLTNGYRAPVPTKFLNQRQKRKRSKW